MRDRDGSDNQIEFVFSREEKLMLIAAAEFDLSPTLTRRLRALVEQLELVSGSRGCFPSQALLAGRLGVTARCVREWLRLGERLKVIAALPRVIAGYGQIENTYHVDWTRVRSSVPQHELTRIDHRLGRLSPVSTSPKTRPKISGGAKKFPGPPGNLFRGPPEATSARLSEVNEEIAAAARRLVDFVFSCGVDRAQDAVDAALAGGCTPEQIQATADWYRQHKDRMAGGPGVLYVQLMRMTPGQPVDRGWPKLLAERPTGVSKSSQAFQIIRNGRRAHKSDDEIRGELATAGLTWDDQDC
jgi:hypothetical protein